MDLLPLFQWFEATKIGTIIRESIWLFPVIQCGHLLALAMLGGCVLVIDLRLLGLGLRDQAVDGLARKIHPWLLGSLVSIIGTGILMFLSEAQKCFYSPPFWYKMALLVAATLFTLILKRRILAAGGGTMRQRLTAAVSLALWFGVAFSGRWIAFY